MALDSYADIKSWILRKAEEPTDGSSDWDADADNALVDAWRDLYTRHPWIALQVFPPMALLLIPPIENLTVTAAIGTSVSGTLSATYATSLVGYVFIPTGQNYLSRITAHAAGTNAVTFDVVQSTLAASAGVITQIEYDIPANVGLFVNGMWGPHGEFIPIRDDEELRGDYSDPPRRGLADYAARIGKTKLRFTHYADQYYRLEAPYTKEPAQPSGTTTLEIDAHLRPIFADLGAYQLLLLKSDPTRAGQYQARAEAKIERAITYEDRVRLTMGRISRRTVAGPYHDGRRYWRSRYRRMF
jgi:hypothetical protein